jgi:hypothetical protein
LALRPDSPQSREEQLAARKAAENDVLLREVDDALRQDEMSGAIKRFGIPLGAGIVAILAAFAGYLWWDGSQKSGASERGEQLTMALDKVEHRQLAEGDKALMPLTNGSAAGTRAAAVMMRGGVALEQGKREEAAKFFAQVAADGAAPQPYRDLATIREVAVRFDAMPPQQVVDKLKPLAVPGNAWLGSAGELLGIAYLKQGKTDLAGPLFASIARDKTAPESLRARARQMAGLLGVDAIDDVDKAAGVQGAQAQ